MRNKLRDAKSCKDSLMKLSEKNDLQFLNLILF